MRGKIFLRWICVVMASVVIAAGWILLPERREPISQADREAEKQAQAFHGMLTLWHVNSWGTGGTGASNLISEVLAELERSYEGVYFVLENLTIDQAQERMARGEIPDILSFPGGMTLPGDAAWQDFTIPEVQACYQESCRKNPCFLPWIASDAVVMIRNTSLAACGETAPNTNWTLDDLRLLAEKLTYQTKGRNAQTIHGMVSGQGRWPQLSLWGMNEDTLLGGEFTEREAWNQLVEGNVSILLAGPWEEMTLAWRLQENRGPDLTVLPWPMDTPVIRSVQWIGCRLSGDEKRDELCRKAAERLLSERVQKKVAEQAKCLAVIVMEENVIVSPQRSVLYALPGRTVTIHDTWQENNSWGMDSGVYLWNP